MTSDLALPEPGAEAGPDWSSEVGLSVSSSFNSLVSHQQDWFPTRSPPLLLHPKKQVSAVAHPEKRWREGWVMDG